MFTCQIKSNSKRLSKGFKPEQVLLRFMSKELVEEEFETECSSSLDRRVRGHLWNGESFSCLRREAGDLLLDIMEGVFWKVLAAIFHLPMISLTSCPSLLLCGVSGLNGTFTQDGVVNCGVNHTFLWWWSSEEGVHWDISTLLLRLNQSDSSDDEIVDSSSPLREFMDEDVFLQFMGSRVNSSESLWGLLAAFLISIMLLWLTKLDS